MYNLRSIMFLITDNVQCTVFHYTIERSVRVRDGGSVYREPFLDVIPVLAKKL